MPPADYDVFLCCHEPSGRADARRLAAVLARRGFRVFLEDRTAGPGPDPRRLRLIGDLPDFVLLLTAGAADALASPGDPVHDETARALGAGRNVVPVLARDAARPSPSRLPSDLSALSATGAIAWDATAEAESAALLAHRLASDGTVDDRRLMRRFKQLLVAAALILVGGVALQEIPAMLERWSRPALLDPVPPFALYWSGFGQRLEGGRWVDFAIANDTAVTGGDQVRLVFGTSADGHAYVVSRNARGEVAVLFPPDAIRGASRVTAGEQYVAPVGGGWLTIDEQAGPDTLFIIAGYDALQNLEELIEEPEATTTAAARRMLLESTVAGLLDGRHGAAERRVWTGKLHPIDRALASGPGPSSASVTLADGAVSSRAFTAQPGLVSASVEIRLQRR